MGVAPTKSWGSTGGRRPAVGAVLRRARLENALDEALVRRLTTVVAAAGFGKSTLLASWAEDVEAAWLTLAPGDDAVERFVRRLSATLHPLVPQLPQDLVSAGSVAHRIDPNAFASRLADELAALLEHDVVLILDDFHELGRDGPAVALVASLVRQAPQRFHVVLSTRSDIPFAIERLRGQGEVLSITAAQLAFSTAEIGEALSEALGPAAMDAATTLHEYTGGWPAAVRLAIESLRDRDTADRSELLATLHGAGGPLFPYLAEEVFARQPEPVLALLRDLAPLESFTPEIARRLGHAEAVEIVEHLRSRGLFLQRRHDAISLHALVRAFALEQWPRSAERTAQVHRTAAEWFEQEGRPREALRVLVLAGDGAGVAGLLETSWHHLISQGDASLIVDAVPVLPKPWNAELERTVGLAHAATGGVEQALACLQRATDGIEELPAGLAWPMLVACYFANDFEQARSVVARTHVERAASADDALFLAWKAQIAQYSGDLETAAAAAAYALTEAERLGDDVGISESLHALGLVASKNGEREAAEEYHLRALAYAERASHLIQTSFLKRYLAELSIARGAYDEAQLRLEDSMRFTELAGYDFYHGRGLVLRAEIHAARGELESARADIEEALPRFRRLGRRQLAVPLLRLGAVERERGSLVRATALVEEARRLGEEVGDAAVIAAAQAELALLHALDEPEAAAGLAAAAIAGTTPAMLDRAQVAAGWVALARADGINAAHFAAAALGSARTRRDPLRIARALELAAAAEPDDGVADALLQEALALWRDIGNPVAEATVELAREARKRETDGRVSTRGAERRLRRLGVNVSARGPVGLLWSLRLREIEPLAIRTFGRFVVERDGVPVPIAEWRSKKARDLLKLLVLRRGRPLARDAAAETLWPEADPTKLGNRLSVALSTLRTVLDPDRRFPPDHYVRSDTGAMSLDLTHASIDLHDFLTDADTGFTLLDDDYREPALEYLAAAEAACRGGFLEEDLYEEWSTPMREQVRAAYVRAARALADAAIEAADADRAATYLLRVLERDEHDEEAHLRLVVALEGAGRRGESRRAYARYLDRMEQLGIEPAPFPAVGSDTQLKPVRTRD